MERDAFWRLIETCRTNARGDQATYMSLLYTHLEHLSPEEVVSFDSHVRACMKAANRTDIFAASTIIDGFWMSSDGFQDFRGWLVSEGREVFESVLADPDNLADVLDLGDDFDFEDFCYIPGRVWEEKTGRDRDQMYPEGKPPSQSTGAEGPKFESEAEVRRRFPRLWAKFGEGAT